VADRNFRHDERENGGSCGYL